MKALNPDISLVHGWAADAEGNTLIAAPYGGNNYGALAAKEGVIVTGRKNCGRRLYPALFLYDPPARLCGQGGLSRHPWAPTRLGITLWDFPNSRGTARMRSLSWRLVRPRRSLRPIRPGLINGSWDAATTKHSWPRLGQQRIWFLKGRIQSDSWESGIDGTGRSSLRARQATDAERIVHAASGKLHEIIKSRKYRLGLCGIGISNLAAWMAYYRLRQEGYPFELVAEIGFYGYSPKASDPFIFNLRKIRRHAG